MKKLYSFLIFLFLWPLLQANEIEGNSWFLKKVTINDTVYERPDFYSTYNNTYFSGGNMFSSICISGGIVAHYELNETSSEILFIGFTPYDGECEEGDPTGYQAVFFEFFENNLNTVLTYGMENVSDVLTLSISNTAGDQLIFENVLSPIPPEILATNWYLHDLIIDGVDYPAPYNEEITDVPLSFTGGFFNTSMCGYISAVPEFEATAQTLNLYDMVQGLTECSSYYGNDEFQNRYFGFFWANLFEDFGYELINNPDESNTLIISDINGNQAIYGNQMMAVSDVVSSQMKISPNPFTDKLNVLLPENITGNYLFQVSDLTGKIIYSKKQNDKSFIWQGNSLPEGVYIVSIESNGKIISQKVIKK